jgi:sortase A
MKDKKNRKIYSIFNRLGNILILISILGIYLTFRPVINQEVRYQSNKITNILLNNKNDKYLKEITPPNLDFSIVIPKINASAPVTANVNPYDESEFLGVLKKGVAHAKGTPYPGREGNTYIFAHSTDAFFNVGRYNAVFYLIGKLEDGDEIDIYFQGEKYVYIVYDKKVVEPNEIEFLNNVVGEKRLTLQTCYPPGTTIKRLVVLARSNE